MEESSTGMSNGRHRIRVSQRRTLAMQTTATVADQDRAGVFPESVADIIRS